MTFSDSDPDLTRSIVKAVLDQSFGKHWVQGVEIDLSRDPVHSLNEDVCCEPALLESVLGF